MKNWYSGYNFHPVGQGLFTSGVFQLEGADPYWWVFDCGTYLKKHQVDLTKEIDQLSHSVTISRPKRAPKLDMVFISHFDRDHINGLLELLAKFEVGRLVLPYIPLGLRISIAMEVRASTFSDWQLFVIDPVKYIASAQNINVERVAVVLPASVQMPENQDILPITSDDGVFIEPPPLRRPTIVDEGYIAGNYPVEWLSPSTRFNIKGIWEFIPYNDSYLKVHATVPFQKAIGKLTSTLLDPAYLGNRGAVKASMERIYNKTFGASPRLRNLISLFVYAGPINCTATEGYAYNTSNELTPAHWELLNKIRYPYYWHWFHRRARVGGAKSLLLTGDGSLSTSRQLEQLVNYLGQSRIDCIQVFQVMHHGARTSWSDEVAEVIAPEFSVFCAFPFGSHPHPHPAVEFALRAHGPVYCRTGYGFTLWQAPFE
ncbi:hypothetical protein EGJ22_18295 [Pseudomonas sp. p99-361]|uniref:Metallo-beta-lactamase domain-containing protein n=1 Tax=Pseudomonas putida TaxID=303 RepID=A0A7W2QLQ5_PSEPU|nr:MULTISPECIES: hypothetical protein [Pseudomonas]MBA6118884.1 hypothetical protein [Pseudomonas putida]MCO1621633.1 hypothetical protein [Pseudomonas putida]PZQ36621.1 MAG: hypothetical protein DI560_24200 [Pseudomonas putida]QNL87909.1 Uncharacterized protein PPKH_2495 [Pseudomonas putida]RRV14867.1 hypothetical protein EGJ22_18295 [Pseudomonas sp. p99-361]